MSERDRRSARRRVRAARVYALLLRLYPAAHRRAFGQQMLQAFRDHYRDAVEMGGESGARFWLGVVGDAGRSLVGEHRAALSERNVPVKKALVGLCVAGLAVMVLLVLVLPARGGPAGGGSPLAGDSVLRALLQLAALGLTLGLYAALVATIVLFARHVLRSGKRPGWVRLGLVLGGVFGLYTATSHVLGVFLPAPNDGGQFGGHLLATLPLLLTGVVGVIGGYSRSAVRGGAFAGLLAACLGVIADQLGTVLALALAWLAIQHHAGPAGIANDYQSIVRNSGHVPDLGTYVSLAFLQDGVGLPIVFGLIALTLQGLSATLGGWIGASLRRADDRGQRIARPSISATRPVTFLVATLALGLLAWVAAVELNALGAAHRLFGLSDLGTSVATGPFGLWVLGCLIGFAFALVGGRPVRGRTAAGAA